MQLWLLQLQRENNSPNVPQGKKYRLEAQIENVKYWIDYIAKQGDKLFTQTHIKAKENFSKWEMDNVRGAA